MNEADAINYTEAAAETLTRIVRTMQILEMLGMHFLWVPMEQLVNNKTAYVKLLEMLHADLDSAREAALALQNRDVSIPF